MNDMNVNVELEDLERFYMVEVTNEPLTAEYLCDNWGRYGYELCGVLPYNNQFWYYFRKIRVKDN